jgi:formyl-CoA transferase/CoA:oxalate CoA-transferase
MKLAFAISSALFAREKYHQGSQIFISMLGCSFDLLEQNLIEASVTRHNPQKVGNMDNAIAPFGLFKTKDGTIALAIGNDTQWRVFSNEFKNDQPKFMDKRFESNKLRLTNVDKLQEFIEKTFSYYTTLQIINRLQKIQIPAGVSKTMLDIIHDQDNYKLGLLKKINHPDIGEFVVPTGGIFFSNYQPETYQLAPQIPKKV